MHFRYGAFLNIQDSERGIDEIKKAVELAPDHVPALVGLTVIYLKREEVDTALEYGERAVKAEPGEISPRTLRWAGRCWRKKNPARAARRNWSAAVKLAPASPEAHFSLASAYSRLGRKEDSARELAEFKRLEHSGEVIGSERGGFMRLGILSSALLVGGRDGCHCRRARSRLRRHGQDHRR